MLQSPCRGCQYQGKTYCRRICWTLKKAQEEEVKRIQVRSAVTSEGEGYSINFDAMRRP